MWRAHVIAISSLRNSSWHHIRDPTVIDRSFYIMIYGTEMKRRHWTEGDEMGSLPKTSHGGIQARMHKGFRVHVL